MRTQNLNIKAIRELLRQRSGIFWVLAAFLCLTFLIGGGSRADIQSNLFLRPVAALVCAFGAFNLGREHFEKHKGSLLLFAACVILVAAHLIPLPPVIWQNLPGRDLIMEIDDLSGLGAVWRPLSLAPSHTWNALFSLLVPMGVLLLAVQLGRTDKRALFVILILIGFFSALLGVVQLAGDPRGPAYFYDITNPGMAVGLFANRNHQAVFLALLLPMIAAIVARQDKWASRWVPLLISAIFILPAILVTGSRAGLLVGFLGAVAAIAIQRRSPWKEELGLSERRRAIPLIAGALAFVSLLVVTVLMSRAEALTRLLDDEFASDLRAKTFEPILQEVVRYFPFGSGAGTFDPVYRVAEPEELLSPYYFNHAHNDLLEVALTLGLPGLLLIGAIFVWCFRLTRKLRSRSDATPSEKAYSMAATVTILLLALGSLADYPLRVPSLMCIVVICLVMLEENAARGRSEHRI